MSWLSLEAGLAVSRTQIDGLLVGLNLATLGVRGSPMLGSMSIRGWKSRNKGSISFSMTSVVPTLRSMPL